MEIPETKPFIPKPFELGTTLSLPIGSIGPDNMIDEIKIKIIFSNKT